MFMLYVTVTAFPTSLAALPQAIAFAAPPQRCSDTLLLHPAKYLFRGGEPEGPERAFERRNAPDADCNCTSPCRTTNATPFLNAATPPFSAALAAGRLLWNR